MGPELRAVHGVDRLASAQITITMKKFDIKIGEKQCPRCDGTAIIRASGKLFKNGRLILKIKEEHELCHWWIMPAITPEDTTKVIGIVGSWPDKKSPRELRERSRVEQIGGGTGSRSSAYHDESVSPTPLLGKSLEFDGHCCEEGTGCFGDCTCTCRPCLEIKNVHPNNG